MITFHQKGDFSRLNRYFEKLLNVIKLGELDKYGRQGVAALASATPKDTGKTADSWGYDIVRSKDSVAIQWYNTNINKNVKT